MELTIAALAVVAVTALFVLKRMTLASEESARRLLAEGAIIIDVRSPEEFRGGQVPGAINIPLDQLKQTLPRRVPDSGKPILLHCLSGTRSGMAKQQLKSMGYTNAHNLGSYRRAKKIVEGQKK
jgi:phage shock protein E